MRFLALLDVRFEFSMKKYPRRQNLSSRDSIFDHFPPSANFQAPFFFRLSAVTPSYFLIFGTKSSESGLGTPSKTSGLKFCIEWSNRELLRPSRRRDMAISLFRPWPLFPAFGADVPAKDGSAGRLCAPKRAQSTTFAKLSKAKLRA